MLRSHFDLDDDRLVTNRNSAHRNELLDESVFLCVDETLASPLIMILLFVCGGGATFIRMCCVLVFIQCVETLRTRESQSASIVIYRLYSKQLIKRYECMDNIRVACRIEMLVFLWKRIDFTYCFLFLKTKSLFFIR